MCKYPLVVVLLLAGCRSSGTPAPANPNEETADTAVTAPQAPDDSPTRVHITAADAEAHGLSPFDFSIDTAGTIMGAFAFPDEGEYLSLSGPPGGPLMIRFLSLPERAADAAALEPILRQRFSHQGEDPLVFGAPTDVPIGGSPRPALPFVTGRSMARTGWCAILIDSRLREAAPQLLVLAGIGSSGDPDCAVPLADMHLGRILESLRQP